MKPLLFIVFASVMLSSCTKPKKYSEIPVVAFKEIPVKDTIVFENSIQRCVLSLSLIDGDGDIGFKANDTLAPFNFGSLYYYNLYINMYKMVNGISMRVDTPELKTLFYFRTPYIEPNGQNKTIKCTIEANLDFDTPSGFDSVWFDFFMFDRSQHKSNVARTPVIHLK